MRDGVEVNLSWGTGVKDEPRAEQNISAGSNSMCKALRRRKYDVP